MLSELHYPEYPEIASLQACVRNNEATRRWDGDFSSFLD